MSPVSHTIPLRPVAPRPPRSAESRLRALLALAAAVICGLSIAVAALAGDDGGAKAAGVSAVPQQQHAETSNPLAAPAPPPPAPAEYYGLQLRGSKASATGR